MTTVTGEGAPLSAISEQQWQRLLGRVDGGKVIPVIGEQLTSMSRGDPPAELSLAAYLAAELNLTGDAAPHSLNELAYRYLRENPRGSEDLYADIFQALPVANDFPLPTPLRQLAEIRSFDMFVTTSFDPYLALALNEVRFGRRTSGSTRVLAYERIQADDIPEKFRNVDYPIVYHLFGKAQAAPLFAVTDEDVLECVHTLQAPERLPPNLAAALREQRLLIIGTRMTGWLARFFLRISSADRLRDARRADYLVDTTGVGDPEQTLFFEQFGEVKVLPMPAASFIDELCRRWKARHPEVAARTTATRSGTLPPGGGEVFLSYASEDLAVVKVLRERLEREAGVRVWLDRDALRGGDQWERTIADVLRSCSVFVPVVSANVKTGGFRYVRSEWNEAIRLRAGRSADAAFIMPVVLDDTPRDDAKINPEIRAIHWSRWHEQSEMDQFIARVRDSVEKQRSP
jgi:hypothetical protein